LADVPLVKGNKDRSLVGEVLIQRSDTDTGGLGDPVGGDRLSVSALEQLDNCVEHRLHRQLRPLLNWRPASRGFLSVPFHLGSIDGNVSFILSSRITIDQ
jgi:hypothetical protein